MSHSRGDHEEYDDDNEDLKPSAEDLQIFEELDREQEEREARIARGEPPVDPMVSAVKISNCIKIHSCLLFYMARFKYIFIKLLKSC